MKKHNYISQKIISLVYLISLISYCNTELKRNKQKTTIQLMLTNKIQKKREKKKRHKLLLMSNMVPI